MITCEWSPGAAPTMAPFAVAVRSVVPEADRAELIRQFEAKAYADQIDVYRDRVESRSGRFEYHLPIARMTTGWGKVCDRVTMTKWKPSDVQSALVFHVNGRAYAYAAVCRNLWPVPMIVPRLVKLSPPSPEQTLERELLAPPVPPAPVAPPVIAEAAPQWPSLWDWMPETLPPVPVPRARAPSEEWPPVVVPEQPTRNVPEPGTVWSLLVALAAAWLARHRMDRAWTKR